MTVDSVGQRYFLLKWKKTVHGCRPYEIRRMEALEEDAAYKIIDTNLTFAEAEARIKAETNQELSSSNPQKERLSHE